MRASAPTLALLAIACAPRYGAADNPTRITDTSGATFGWSCTDAQCDATLLPESPPPLPCGDGDRASYSYFWGRFVTLCSVCAFATGHGWGTFAGACRPLACHEDRDCPLIYQFDPVSIYACVDGLCQNVDVTNHPRDHLTEDEVVTLCYAAHPRDETASVFAPESARIDALVAAQCSPTAPNATCPLPAECTMP